MSRRRRHVALFGMLGSLACASGGANAPRAAETPATRIDEPIRALTIVPSARKACPGGSIAVRYEATTSSGQRVTLTGANLELLDRSGVGAVERADGAWVADGNPLVTAMSGFRFHAALKSDSTIHADTVVAPTYACPRRAVSMMAGHIRLGVFRSAFYDSIVVAVVETNRGPSELIVLGPGEMTNGAIRVDATGKDGIPGARGRNGTNGASCEAGQPGEEGGDGTPGTDGGRVDLIVQADAMWLENLVSVANSGGRGGAGGPGGAGGQAGPRGSTTGSTGRGAACSTSRGRPGMPGRAGANGIPGPPPKTSTIPLPLLWTGSQLWANQDFRTPLEQLIELTQR